MLRPCKEYLAQSFPPCMRRLVLQQRDGVHLKHLGRLQLRPFLREAGLGLREALVWWARELCRDASITPDAFQRNYRYDVEHAWGARGHGRGAFAFSCARLFGLPPQGPATMHGCPFQSLGAAELARDLATWGAPRDSVGQVRMAGLATAGLSNLQSSPFLHNSDNAQATSKTSAVLSLAVRGHPRAACAQFFRATHPGFAGSVPQAIVHPNAFSRLSREHFKALQSRGSRGAVGTELRGS
mmetsp:Transcript_131752/g.421699  ORF Transcript_131752/g.421699 Transcript_131752/m.421699 type:complete len:241 (+) Transcript_131752:1997-2719(+)